MGENESSESKHQGSALQGENRTLQEENKTLRGQVASCQSEMEEDRLLLEGLQSGINMLKKEVSDHKMRASEEKQKRLAAEKEIIELKEVESLMIEEKQKGEATENKLTELRNEKEIVE